MYQNLIFVNLYNYFPNINFDSLFDCLDNLPFYAGESINEVLQCFVSDIYQSFSLDVVVPLPRDNRAAWQTDSDTHVHLFIAVTAI